ncbi:MAG: glycosyltransferase family 2 protein, partial [Cyanobacteria bacterium J06598_3]
HEFCPYGQTANLGVRLKALEQVGLFRPYLTTGGDADICWRVQQETDWQIQYAEEAVIQHRHRQTLKDLYSQWHRYGTSNRYLHELHGVKLAWPMNPKDRKRTIRRWALKELPIAAMKFVFAKGATVDMVSAPLDLYCARARAQGQAEARLPDNARNKVQLNARHAADAVG